MHQVVIRHDVSLFSLLFVSFQTYPFMTKSDEGMIGEMHYGPSTGIYYRHELFYNPQCKEAQDLFDDGFIYVEKLLSLAQKLVGVMLGLALYVGLFFTICTRKHRLQSISVEHAGGRIDKVILIAMIVRVSAVVLLIWCAVKASSMQRYFAFDG